MSINFLNLLVQNFTAEHKEKSVKIREFSYTYCPISLVGLRNTLIVKMRLDVDASDSGVCHGSVRQCR